MQVIDGLEALEANRSTDPRPARSVVSVGVFDGVHLGHLRLLHELQEFASEQGGVATVVTFRHHPDRILHGTAPQLIVSVPHRLRLLRRAGVGRCALLEFDEQLRNMTAVEFARRILANGLACCGLLLGFDSALGRDREGTPEYLRRVGLDLGFAVREAKPFAVEGVRPSSTAIRAAIQAGDLVLAHRMLGRWPSIMATVVQGDRRGRTLGFPTANLHPENQTVAPFGVYAVQVVLEGEPRPGVANLGIRPTFGLRDPVLEVHLLDFSGDLYGKTLEVGFVHKIRDEAKFASIDALKAQIAMDAARARELLRG